MTPLWSWMLVLAVVAAFCLIGWLVLCTIDDMIGRWRNR